MGCDSQLFCTKELLLTSNPEIPLFKALKQGIPMCTTFEGIQRFSFLPTKLSPYFFECQSNLILYDFTLSGKKGPFGEVQLCQFIVQF